MSTTTTVITVIAVAAIVLGIWAMVKSSPRHRVMPWWGHLLMLIFLFPISIFTSIAEIYQQSTYRSSGRDRDRDSDRYSDSDTPRSPRSPRRRRRE
jgi:hypothetical protein